MTVQQRDRQGVRSDLAEVPVTPGPRRAGGWLWTAVVLLASAVVFGGLLGLNELAHVLAP